MEDIYDDATYRLNEARRKWGKVFSDFRDACEMVNSAWYHVKDKQALAEEDVSRLRALIGYAQKEIEAWEERRKWIGRQRHEHTAHQQ